MMPLLPPGIRRALSATDTAVPAAPGPQSLVKTRGGRAVLSGEFACCSVRLFVFCVSQGW